MAIHKKGEFPLIDQELADFAKALSHPARIVILNYLSKKNECICGEIVDKLPLAQSTVSQHLKELKSAGLIKGTISGPKTCYCIDSARFKQLSSNLEKYLQGINLSEIEKCC